MNYKKIDLKFDESAPSVQYPVNKFSPYNSQNTLFAYDAFWSLYLPTSVSFRLTDIWRSYWAQRLMWLLNGTITFKGPNAYQLRNSHSYLNDFYQEKEMYMKTEKLITFLFEWQCYETKFYACVIDLSEEMAKNEFWSNEEVLSIKNWLQDLENIGYIEPKMQTTNSVSLTRFLLLNKSLIDESFNVRYTPKFQKSIDFDSYCCARDSMPLNELEENFKSIQYLENFCKLSNYSLKYDSNNFQLLSSNSSDITLLITFNIQIRKFTIELIKHIYGSYFKNIIFCGKNIANFLNESRGEFKRFDDFTFIDLDTTFGYFHYYCMTKVIEMNFNTKGVLLMSDDVLLKYWSLEKLDINKIWFPDKIECSYELNSSLDSGWTWWNGWYGKTPYRNLLNHINKLKNLKEFDKTEYGKMLKEYELFLQHNSKNDSNSTTVICSHMGSDTFYVPKSKFKFFHFISNLFRHYNIFLELAVPGILSGLDYNFNMNILNGTYDWSRREIFDSYAYDKIGSFFHPSKLFVYNASLLGNKFCKHFIQDKLNKYY